MSYVFRVTADKLVITTEQQSSFLHLAITLAQISPNNHLRFLINILLKVIPASAHHMFLMEHVLDFITTIVCFQVPKSVALTLTA